MNVNNLIIAYVSFPKIDLAKAVAKRIVSNKLAACVKVINNIDSFYIWEDKLEEGNEVYLMMKTKEEKVKEIKDVLDEMHPFEVYEFIYVEAKSGNDKYLAWVNSALNKNI
jgi:periplasmic divalent cation tolerance protein